MDTQLDRAIRIADEEVARIKFSIGAMCGSNEIRDWNNRVTHFAERLRVALLAVEHHARKEERWK